MNSVAMTVVNPTKEYWQSRAGDRTSDLLFSSPQRYKSVLQGLGLAFKNVTANYDLVIHDVRWYTDHVPERSLFDPLPDDKILDWSKLKQIANDILKCI